MTGDGPATRPVVAVILPARNEAAALPAVFAEIPRALVHDIIVVDNGSTDDTAAVARRLGARVVREPVPGYGRACLAGLRALPPAADTVVFLDADHSDDPGDLPALLAPLVDGRADLVIGARTRDAAARRALTPQQRIGNALACWLIARRWGVCFTDLGPFRAIQRTALERLGVQDRGFGWTVEMQVKAVQHGLRVVEVPVRYRPRIGRSKISGTLRGAVLAGTTILWTIARLAWRQQGGHEEESRS